MTVVADTTVAIPTRVLVFGMAHLDGTILAAEIAPVAEACGFGAEQLRSCLRRLMAEGLLVRHGSGPEAIYQATDAGMAELGASMERTRLAYAQDAAGRGWDRRWRLVGYAVPEERRAARDAFRDRLLVLGGAQIQGGLYVSAHRWLDEVQAEAERLGVAALVTTSTTDDLRIGTMSDPRDLARRLWPIERLGQQYQAFVERYAALPEGLRKMRGRKQRLPDTAFLPGAFAMAVAFQAVFDEDPLLPPELLPRPWPGRAARELLITSRRLALTMLERPGRPALFHLFDETLEALP